MMEPWYGLMQERCNSIANTLELRLSCTNPSICTGYWITHWGRVTHICVGKPTIIVSDNGLSPGRRQAIIWNNAGILLIGPLGTKLQWNFNPNSYIFIQENALENIVCEMASILSRPQWDKLLSSVHPQSRAHSTVVHIVYTQAWFLGVTYPPFCQLFCISLLV